MSGCKTTSFRAEGIKVDTRRYSAWIDTDDGPRRVALTAADARRNDTIHLNDVPAGTQAHIVKGHAAPDEFAATLPVTLDPTTAHGRNSHNAQAAADRLARLSDQQLQVALPAVFAGEATSGHSPDLDLLDAAGRSLAGQPFAEQYTIFRQIEEDLVTLAANRHNIFRQLNHHLDDNDLRDVTALLLADNDNGRPLATPAAAACTAAYTTSPELLEDACRFALADGDDNTKAAAALAAASNPTIADAPQPLRRYLPQVLLQSYGHQLVDSGLLDTLDPAMQIQHGLLPSLFAPVDPDVSKKAYDRARDLVCDRWLPKHHADYYLQTSLKRFGPAAVGSRFIGMENLDQVVLKAAADRGGRLNVDDTEDRARLRADGATDDAFRDGWRYLTVDVTGELGVISTADLPDDTPVVARRTKDGQPCSLTVDSITGIERPLVDYATVIVGPDPAHDGDGDADEIVITTHPGPPVKPADDDRYTDGQQLTVADVRSDLDGDVHVQITDSRTTNQQPQ